MSATSAPTASVSATPRLEELEPPQLPSGSDYPSLSAHFAPLFERIAAGARDRDLHRELPFAEIAALNRVGFALLRVPREHGGVGASVRTYIRLLIDLAAADSNVAHQYRSHAGFVESLRFLDDDRSRHWYAQLRAGATVGNASTEKGGNALGTLNTVLTQRSGGADQDATWVLDGEKFYATGSLFATHTRVSASLTGPGGDVTGERSFAVVPTTAAGVELEDDWNGFGQKLTATGTARFHEVEVEPLAVLPRRIGTPEAVFEASFFQLVLLAVLAGIARAVREETATGVRERKRTFNTGLGLPYREDPLIQEATGNIAATAFAVEATVLHAAGTFDDALAEAARTGADRHDHSGAVPAEFYTAELAIQQAQITVPEQTIRVASELFLTGGASNTAVEKGLDRHWRNAQTVATHNPIVFRSRQVGDWFINGTLPQGLSAIGDAPASAAASAPTQE
ncbi:acyl-CoA dehydrogenase [Citricoccus muralis]|uniref:Acyl-CoA dehydrogenase n=1 Tax=Citricoccus muralis TaxID=169134 RepID=A0ABY8HB92_9MICC|nr:acyl-CoA dehydrogenase family protein [Citricoccus muralis]WFP17877.1 acyl-CoA dehydrogenase [Citricoccus muralis]